MICRLPCSHEIKTDFDGRKTKAKLLAIYNQLAKNRSNCNKLYIWSKKESQSFFPCDNHNCMEFLLYKEMIVLFLYFLVIIPFFTGELQVGIQNKHIIVE